MISLHVNIDHIATLRQARRISEPDPVAGAMIAELAGAHGITAHLREDRRHIQDSDVRRLRESVKTRFNLEMAATSEMFDIAAELQPDIVTLVPERREEVTTEGGLDLLSASPTVKQGITQLQSLNIRLSAFIDPDPQQVQCAKEMGFDDIELHTGPYVHAQVGLPQSKELARLVEAATVAHEHNLQVNAGHGLNYKNVQAVCQIPHLQELNIGHSIIGHSLFVGLSQAVKEMLMLIQR